MSYLVFARKYRPQTFLEVSGQTQVTRTLAHAIERDKIAHAHLFCGPRGVGKTSIARIFAKCLNCEKDAPTASPCGTCASCKAIANGNHLAVREIDGASNNSVDDVRSLIESFRTLPPPGSKYKVYIIDEVHMLSTSAFNALLKSLEEPPPNTVFILATTEVHKIPETVLSRCQRHDFRALTQAEIEERLQEIADADGIKVEPAANQLVARLADGSMRDAQSLFDRVCAYAEDTVTADVAAEALGVVSQSALAALSEAIIKKEAPRALQLVSEVLRSGADPSLFLKEWVGFWRDLLFVAMTAPGDSSPGIRPEVAVAIRPLATQLPLAELAELCQVVRVGADNVMRSSFLKPALEALVVRVALREKKAAASPASGSVPPTKPSPSAATPGAGSAAVAPAARAATSGIVAATVAASAPNATIASSIPKTLDWAGISAALAKVGGVIMAEQLRRVALKSFAPGDVVLEAPEFTAAYFEKNGAKLKELLAQVTGVAAWRVSVQATKGEVAGSVHAQVKKEQQESRAKRQDSLQSHPSVQALLNAFPGSEIASITVAEE